MPDINPSIPVAGQPNSSEEPKVVTALTQLVAAVNDVDSAQILDATIATADIAALAVTDAKVAASTLTDAKLASPSNGVWRPVASAGVRLEGNVPAGTYYFNSGVATTGTSGSYPFPVWIPATTDYDVAGKTTRLRLVATIVTNGTGPGVNLVYGFHVITAAGGGGSALSPTIGAAAMSVTFATPAAGAGVRSVSTSVDLTALSSTSVYTFGLVLAGATNVNSVSVASLQLEMRHT